MNQRCHEKIPTLVVHILHALELKKREDAKGQDLIWLNGRKRGRKRK